MSARPPTDPDDGPLTDPSAPGFYDQWRVADDELDPPLEDERATKRQRQRERTVGFLAVYLAIVVFIVVAAMTWHATPSLVGASLTLVLPGLIGRFGRGWRHYEFGVAIGIASILAIIVLMILMMFLSSIMGAGFYY